MPKENVTQEVLENHLGITPQAVGKWERAYAEFPDDRGVMDSLMMAVNQEEQWPCPKAHAERIFSLGERILQESTETQLREDAIKCLFYL